MTDSADVLTPTDDTPTQPCADILSLTLLWQKRQAIKGLQLRIQELQAECAELANTALRTMPQDVAVPFYPGYVAICDDLCSGQISFYPVEGE